MDINGAINATEEEAGNGGDFGDITAIGGEFFEAADVGPGTVDVALNGKEESDVDVDPFTDHLFDSGESFGGARDLDHDIGMGDRGVVAAGFPDGVCRAAGDRGRDFDADVAVESVGAIVDRTENIAGIADVAEDEGFVDVQEGFTAADARFNVSVVDLITDDGFLEDGRVRCNAKQATGVDKFFEFARGDEVPGEVIHPDTLAELFDRLDTVESGIHKFSCGIEADAVALVVNPTLSSQSYALEMMGFCWIDHKVNQQISREEQAGALPISILRREYRRWAKSLTEL